MAEESRGTDNGAFHRAVHGAGERGAVEGGGEERRRGGGGGGRACQIMLATSCGSIQLKRRGSKMWMMTWPA